MNLDCKILFFLTTGCLANACLDISLVSGDDPSSWIFSLFESSYSSWSSFESKPESGLSESNLSWKNIIHKFYCFKLNSIYICSGIREGHTKGNIHSFVTFDIIHFHKKWNGNLRLPWKVLVTWSWGSELMIASLQELTENVCVGTLPCL